MLVPPSSSGGIVVYVKHGALSSILGLELPRKTEGEGRDGEGRLAVLNSRNTMWVRAGGFNTSI